MIYIIRGLVYMAMGILLLKTGGPVQALGDVIMYFTIFLFTEAGILLAARHRLTIIEAVADLVIVVILFSGWVDDFNLLVPLTGLWFFLSGIGHIAFPGRPGYAAFLVIAVGIVMILFGLILFFREGLGMAGFMGLTGMFLLLSGTLMVIGGFIGGRKKPG